MSGFKHTPGPWVLAGDDSENGIPYLVIEAATDPIAHVQPAFHEGAKPDFVITDETWANGYLIAAALDLLAFVKREADRDPVFAKGSAKVRIAEARALVAQATGAT